MESDLERIRSGVVELIPCLYIGGPAAADPAWQRANQITHAQYCYDTVENGNMDENENMDGVAEGVTTNAIPLPADGEALQDDTFADMMSDASDFLSEGLNSSGKVVLLCPNEVDRAVVVTVHFLCTKHSPVMKLDEALRAVKEQLPDYFMSRAYHAKLKQQLQKSDPARGEAKNQQKPKPRRKEPPKGESFFIECPTCGIMIEITNVRCGTFRCGVYKKNGRPLPPHSNQMVCEDAVKRGLIYGCGSPFKDDGVDPPVALSWEDAKSWNVGKGGKGSKGGKGGKKREGQPRG